MTKKNILYMYIISIAITAVIFIFSLSVSFRNEPTDAETIGTEPVVSSEGYILGEYEGKLALYRTGNDTPYKKLNFMVSMLTEYDRENVMKGIYAETEAELNALIEDLTS